MRNYARRNIDARLLRNIAASTSTTISNTDNTTFHATRFARRSLLKHTKSLLQKYLPLLDQLSSTAGRDTIHGMQLSASYVSQVVHSATTTVDALLWRALREGRETRRHKNVLISVNKKKVLSKRRDPVAVVPQNGVEAEGGENDNQHQRREKVMKQEVRSCEYE